MKILGIETSCDETAVAVVENGTKILSNVVASSAEMHAKTGGIIPEQAARQQIKFIIPVVDEALKKAGVNHQYIDVLAVTVGPGLIGSLLVGVETTKTLAMVWKKPIIPVNHLVAHIYANFLGGKRKIPEFPALCLVVSGGHTDLVLMHNHPSAGSGQAKNLVWVGGTRDDAAGEAFDKCARLLGLPYPGGPSIAAEAERYLIHNTKNLILNLFPRPLIDENTYDFSFSGLKTAVARKVKEQEGKRVKVKTPQLAAEIQEAIVDVLVNKTLKAVVKFKPKSLLLSGGVAANKRLREKMESQIMNYELRTKLIIPEPKLCTDNAAVIASCAFFNHKSVPWKKIAANPAATITQALIS